ncbi:MAG: IS1 family transposase [Aggregatilineales bacterium]
MVALTSTYCVGASSWLELDPNHQNRARTHPQPFLTTCPIYTDHWEAYTLVLPPDQHIASGKGAGQTNHQERWNNTLRQWLGRYTRRTLSFSKADRYHELITRWFILEYNLAIQVSLTL